MCCKAGLGEVTSHQNLLQVAQTNLAGMHRGEAAEDTTQTADKSREEGEGETSKLSISVHTIRPRTS